jgi:hypothetical protein
MKIGKMMKCSNGLFGSSINYFLLIVAALGLFFMSIPSIFAFDRVENWGFDHGGGYRIGSFTGEDAGMVVTSMETSPNKDLLAVAGTIENDWAVRVYSLSSNGPEAFVEWTAAGETELPFSTIISLAWLDGALACGVEYLEGDEINAGVLFLNPENVEQIKFSELKNWGSLCSVQRDFSDGSKLWVSGTRRGMSFCRLINSSNNRLDEFRIENLSKLRAMVVQQEKVWICGENLGGNSFVELFIDGKRKKRCPLGERVYISAMEVVGANIFLTGRRVDNKSKDEMENYFLICLSWDERKNEIAEKWIVETESFDSGLDREVGTALLPLSDGSVLVAGNFRRYWKLGPSQDKKLALLPPDSSVAVNFEGFLARFDSEGNLLWAQPSAIMGDDFTSALASVEEGHVLLLGNRIIGGGFGPYLSKVRIDGSEEKNAALVKRDMEKQVVINWEPTKTLRFGEPMDGLYFNARSTIRLDFEYRLNGDSVEDGDIPLFEPGEMEFLVQEIGGEMAAVRTVKGLKGRPYLKVEHEQIGEEVLVSGHLSGLHPVHLNDEGNNTTLHESIQFEFLRQDSTFPVNNRRFFIEEDFNGRLEIVARFPGDMHYEAVSRSVFLKVRNGRVLKPGEDNLGSVSIAVRDLDGWQEERSVLLGQQTVVTATQGFGRKKKFKRWVEFSEDDQILRTANVESPFSLRTALFPEKDMTLFAFYNSTFSGIAVNGYLAGSTVFLDFNLNGKFDEDDEPAGVSSSNGGFEIEISDEEIFNHDVNENGIIDPDEGVLVVLNGMDRASGLPLEISYKAPPSYSVITAISNLVTEFIEEGLGLSTAEEIVSRYLSLPEGINFSTFEPLREMQQNGTKAKEFVLKSTELANVLNQGALYLEIVSGNRISRIQGADLIVNSIKNEIIKVENSSRRSSDSLGFDLNDPSVLLDVLSSAETLSENVIDEFDTEEVLSADSSVRAELSIAQPEIAKTGNEQVLNELVDQISSANDALEALVESPDITPEEFKVLASTSQTVLDQLGEVTSNTLFEEEVDQLVGLTAEEVVQAQDIINKSSQIESLPEEIGIPSGENSSAASFAQDTLKELSTQLDINAFAPVLTINEIVAPKELSQGLVIGSFSAYDPEGEDVTYSIVGQNPDLDSDDVPMLMIYPESGEIVIQDFDDLTLMTEDLVKPIVRVSDESGLFTDEEVTLNLAEWSYLAGRLQIPELALTVPENLPIQTVVHSFETVDVYGGPIEYLLVSGAGDGNNSLFELDANGTLKTKVVFDYESNNDIVEIRVQAIDSRFNVAEDSLQIRITDVIVPSVQTGRAKIVDGLLSLSADINLFGDSGKNLKIGFLVDRNPIENQAGTSYTKILSEDLNNSSFSSAMNMDNSGGYYYFIAFAENEEGINYGLEQSFLVPKINAGSEWVDGNLVDDYSTWWKSPWFGIYNAGSYPWVYHENLGWIYVYSQSDNGTWIYRQKLGWLWTNPDLFPYLYLVKRNSWTYLNKAIANTTLYDYEEEEWFEPDTPIRIFAKEESHLGGEVIGYGNYYRWDSVVLEAKANTNYNFAGWSGGMNSMEQMIDFEATKDLRVNASFLAIPTVNSRAEDTIESISTVLDKMDHLSEAEKEKSIAELLIFGTSPTSGLSIKKKQ